MLYWACCTENLEAADALLATGKIQFTEASWAAALCLAAKKNSTAVMERLLKEEEEEEEEAEYDVNRINPLADPRFCTCIFPSLLTILSTIYNITVSNDISGLAGMFYTWRPTTEARTP